jgi:hypothetical protein
MMIAVLNQQAWLPAGDELAKAGDCSRALAGRQVIAGRAVLYRAERIYCKSFA